VTGVVIRQDWSELEPGEEDFDWSFLDSETARATAAGKEILLRINTQAHKPDWVTTEVQQAGGLFFTFDDNGVQTTIPVFWDSTYLAKKTAMISALGAHLAGSPNLRVVGASFANATSEDWNIPNMPDEIAEWLSLGYTPEKMLDAGQQIIDATMVAFPDQYVTLAIGGDGNLNPSPTYLAENAIAAARASWPGRLVVQVNSLSTFNPPAPGPDDSVWNLLWNSQPDVAAQMLDNVFGDFTYRVNNGVPGDFGEILTTCIDAGATYGVNYIEIYQTDVIGQPEVITYARELLGGPTPTPTPTRLDNISTRLAVGTGDNVLIGGFIITGSESKKIIIRAIGQSLDLAGTLIDPSLELHDSSQQILTTNDDWEENDPVQKEEIIESGLAPSDEKEAVIDTTLEPGAYTAIVRGVNNTSGIGLVELYDLDITNGSKLANISTRGFVQTGDNVMIGGVIIVGETPAEVVVRALGASLPFTGTLADPLLELHDQNGAVIGFNDNWRSDQEAEIIASGLAPPNDAEAAILDTLPAGAYTAIVRGVGDTTGIALVECYLTGP